jgi:acyl-CoA thioester hydrolase
MAFSPVPPSIDVQLRLPDDVPAWLRLFHFWLDVKVRLYETDANGHMSQLTYFGYQEWGSTEYWTAIGFERFVASKSELSLFMGEQYCRFIAEARYGDSLRLGVRCARLGRSSITLEYAFCHADGRLAAIGLNSEVLVEVATRGARELPGDFREAIGVMESGG